ncbi:hypothetical protein Tco_1214260 [Tanacetum coccineum]
MIGITGGRDRDGAIALSRVSWSRREEEGGRFEEGKSGDLRIHKRRRSKQGKTWVVAYLGIDGDLGLGSPKEQCRARLLCEGVRKKEGGGGEHERGSEAAGMGERRRGGADIGFLSALGTLIIPLDQTWNSIDDLEVNMKVAPANVVTPAQTQARANLGVAVERVHDRMHNVGKFSLARIIEARLEEIAEKEKEQIIKKKEDNILSLQSELPLPKIKGSLEADEDIGIEEVSSALDCVFHIEESWGSGRRKKSVCYVEGTIAKGEEEKDVEALCNSKKIMDPERDDPERWIFSITEYFSLLNTPTDQRLRILLQLGTVEDYQGEFEKLMNQVTGISDSLLISFYISGLKLHLQRELLASKPLTLGYVFLLARMIEARLEDNRSTATIAKPNDMVHAQHLEETTFHKSNKVKETEARVEVTVHKENATTEKEETIKETTDTLTLLQSEVASLEAKGSLDANKEIKKDHTLVHELEKQVEKLPMELQLKNNVRGALETKDSLHDLQEVKTKRALKIDDEEFKKAKSEKVYDAWLPPWHASCLVVYQPYVKNHWKEFMFIQGRIWDPRIKILYILDITLRTRWF